VGNGNPAVALTIRADAGFLAQCFPVEKVAVIAAKCAAAYVALDFTRTAAATGIRAFFCHLVKKGKLPGVHLASDAVQKQAANYFDALHSNSFFDKILLPIKRKCHYTNVYTGKNIDMLLFSLGGYAAYTPLFGVLVQRDKELSDIDRAMICHEAGHAKQFSSFSYRLSMLTCLLSSLSLFKLIYKLEYDTEKTKVETLVKLQDYDALRASVNIRVKNWNTIQSLGFLFLFYGKELHPYYTGTLDTYYRIMKKQGNTDSELFKKVAKIVERDNRKLTTNWKEGYDELQNQLSRIQDQVKQRRQQLALANQPVSIP